MSKWLLMSDLHLGHKSICKFRQEFSDAEEHHNTVFENLASATTKRDTIILLGDVAFDEYWNNKISEIKCLKKILILGNHDRDHLSIQQLVPVYDEIYSLWSKRGVWFSHAPIHPDEIRRRHGVFHGHTHNHNINDPRYVNLSVEQTNYKPITFQEAKERLDDAIGKSVQEI